MRPARSRYKAEGLPPPGCEPRCRGCAHRGWEPGRSEAQKLGWLGRSLARHAGAIGPLRAPVEGRRWGYREKACLGAEWDGRRWRLGMRVRLDGGRRGETELVAIPDCPLHSAGTRGRLQVLSEELSGGIPLVYVAASGRILTLVMKSRILPDLSLLFKNPIESSIVRLRTAGVTGLWGNLNPAAGRRVFSSRGWHLLWGEGLSRDSRGLAHGPESFQQLIPELHGEALLEAREFLAPARGDQVLDLCSGTGASLRLWEESGASCAGVELSGEAVRCAAINSVTSVCLRGRASERIPQLELWSREKGSAGGRRLLFANPPRPGLESEVTGWIARFYRPVRIAYLSCSAGTLSRDLDQLTAAGYAVRRITPYDFFPQTHHVETLALLERAP